MVDDCHATGFMGPKGAGTPAYFGISADLLTGTLGKALGGALGGYIAGPQAVIDLLRQRARPYLFSNALPPMVTAAGIEAIRLVEEGDDLRERLFENTAYWRNRLEALGFDLLPGEHPIVPVMLGDARLAQEMAAKLNDLGVYVAGFFFPACFLLPCFGLLLSPPAAACAKMSLAMDRPRSALSCDHELGDFVACA